MPSKNSSGIKGKMLEGKIYVKWVKRANMWCKTWFEYNEKTGAATQKQEWTSEKPSA